MPNDSDEMQPASGQRRLVSLLPWCWLALFGIWPLAHPDHNTFGALATWADLLLHLVGLSVVLPFAVGWFRRREALEDGSVMPDQTQRGN
jgi:hypothetical protein